MFRTHNLPPPPATIALKNAGKAELVSLIDTEANKVQTIYATLGIDTAVRGARLGKQIAGYLWLRKPAMLRIQ